MSIFIKLIKFYLDKHHQYGSAKILKWLIVNSTVSSFVEIVQILY